METTAHGQYDQPEPAVATARSVLSRKCTRVLNTVDLATRGKVPTTLSFLAALENAAVGHHPFGDDLVLRGFPGRVL